MYVTKMHIPIAKLGNDEGISYSSLMQNSAVKHNKKRVEQLSFLELSPHSILFDLLLNLCENTSYLFTFKKTVSLRIES